MLMSDQPSSRANNGLRGLFTKTQIRVSLRSTQERKQEEGRIYWRAEMQVVSNY